MKNAVRAIVAATLTITLVGLPLLPEAPLGQMSVETVRLPLAFASDGESDDGAWVSTSIEEDATVVGLTWDDAETPPDAAEVRVRVDGTWQPWEDVEIDVEHAPDPGSAEERNARGGTAPIIVEGADAVQFRARGSSAPDRVVAELIAVDDPAASRRVESGRLPQAGARPAAPDVHGRDDWNGDSCVDRDPSEIPYVRRVAVLFVHHTVTSTSYAREDVAGILRGICSYHVNSRGWDDIGYNVIVDRFGGIWQGRQGDLERGVIGAHTGGFNSWSHGIALLGNHASNPVSTASLDAITEYGAWYLDLHNVDPRARYTVESGGSSRWSDGTNVTFDAVNGHRAASYTSCPGDYCLGHLGSLMMAMDSTGGFKTYGGWTDQTRYELVDGAWERPEIELWFDEPAAWTLQVRDADGDVVWERTGEGTSRTLTWSATVDGSPAPRGDYTVRVRAEALDDGQAASTAEHDFQLALPPGSFDDVRVSDTFFSDIQWLSLEGITRGCNPPSNTRFCPDRAVTRAQMAAFLSRAADLPDAAHAGFRDVPTTHPFAQDIANLAAAGITDGCGSGNFCPDDDVTREQMAAFLVRAVGLTEIDHPGFRDVGTTNIFRGNIRRLATAGITLGCNPPANDRFCPRDSVTREQMAAFIRRAEL